MSGGEPDRGPAEAAGGERGRDREEGDAFEEPRARFDRGGFDRDGFERDGFERDGFDGLDAPDADAPDADGGDALDAHDDDADAQLEAAFRRAVSGVEDFEPDGDDLVDELEAEETAARLARAADIDDVEEEAQRVRDELLARVGEQAPEPRLEPTRRAVEYLGDVHRAYPVIHLTGTNGKTSTARIIERILRAHGLRTGLITSPHLERLEERIRIDGAPVSAERLVANWDDIAPFIALVDTELEGRGEAPLTFFEALTVLSCACFADAPVDVAIVEVGMGGEWDSTNVMDGEVAVFSPIGLDHVGRLGDTISEIARTKAGIVKPGAAVVSARQEPSALREIRDACEREEATLAVEGEEFAVVADALAVGGRLISVRGLAGEYDDCFLGLAGRHQAENAALAIAAVEAFFGGERQLRRDLLLEGLAEATSPGRLERIGRDPLVLVDAAHNPHAAGALAAAVAEDFDVDRVVVVLGALEGKDAEGVARELAPIASRIIATESDSPRAVPSDELAERLRAAEGIDVEIIAAPDLGDALALARELAAADSRPASAEADGHVRPQRREGVLVTGSITVVGAAMAIARADGWLGA